MAFVKNVQSKNKFHPNMGIGGSIKYIKTDLGEFKRMYDNIEESIRSKGFLISSSNLDNGPNKFITANIFIRILESYGLYFEAGKGTEGKWDTFYTSGSIRYYIDFKRLDWLKLHMGLGYTKIGFKVQENYGTAISTTNNGSYWRLDEINTEGNSKGFTLNLGTDFGLFDYSSHTYLTLFTDFSYSFFEEKQYTVSYTGPEISFANLSKTNFKKFIISIGLNLYF